jgi:YVTN family beta-propeller protein
VIDAMNNSVLTTINVGIYPCALACNANSNKIYSANRSSGNITVIDAIYNNVISTISVGNVPCAFTCNPTDNKIYCANELSNTVTVIDGAVDSVITNIAVGSNPHALVYDDNNNRFYCINRESDNISVIDGANDSVITTIAVGDHPKSFALDSTQNRTYNANFHGTSISVIRESMVGIAENTYILNTHPPAHIAINPNPATKFFSIDSRIPLRVVRIYDVLGTLLKIIDTREIRKPISIRDLSAGVYFLIMNTDDSEFVNKVIVTK